MKKGILILTMFLLGNFAYAQKIGESEVPTSVKTKFASIYPDIKVEKWKIVKGNYEASFDRNATDISIIIDPNGKLLETETSINISSLPKAIRDYLETNYDGKKIKEATKTTHHNSDTIYEVEVHDLNLYFGSNGAFLKSENKNGGVYLTLNDYLNKKINYEINCKTEKETFRSNEFLNESYITLSYNKQKIKLYKDSIYGYLTCDESLIRFQDKSQYYLEEEGPVWIFYLEIEEQTKKEYKAENPYRYVPEKEYYFCTKGDGRLIALTVNNVKQAFLNNSKVQAMMDTQFKNTDIYEYDTSHKMFKLNYFLQQATGVK